MSEVLNYNKITALILDFNQFRYRYLRCSMAVGIVRSRTKATEFSLVLVQWLDT